jgi:hypothetical protein
MPGGTRVRVDFDGRTWKTETTTRPTNYRDRWVVYVAKLAAGVAPLATDSTRPTLPMYLVPLDSVTCIDKRFR